jgi:maleylacetate reductase
VHDAIAAHSPEEDVVGAATAARAAGADLIVAVGGGSVIDATKAMLMCLWETIDSVDGLRAQAARYGGAGPTDTGGAARMLAVPTTLSAAEFTPTAGVTRRDEGVKTAYTHEYFTPRVVVLDPEATLDTPLSLLTITGIRAVDHAVEAFCSPTANPMSDLYGLSAAGLLMRSLAAIVADPAAMAPRQEAQFGMWRAILALTCGAGSGASHGIGYALGAGFGVAHGATSAVMLPAVMRWNEPVTADRQAELAAAFGDPSRPAADHVAALIETVGAPSSLRAVGIEASALPGLAESALRYPAVRRNPRPIRSAADVEEILRMAW